MSEEVEAFGSMEELIQKLQAVPAKGFIGSRWMKQAAVAIVMRESTTSFDLLMIKRATKEGDPWSGHMAFPGGRVDPEDHDPLSASVRETSEEIQLDLGVYGEQVGELSVLPARAGGRFLPMVIFPFLFRLHQEPILFPNHEVDEVVWVPFSFFLDPANRKTMPFRKLGIKWKLPCYHYQEKVIWGLSLQMIDEMMRRVRGQSFASRFLRK